MIYDIQRKNDLSSGAMMVVRIPEEDLDRKALYTLQTDLPEFIVPFRCRSVDGQIEFTYQLGNRSMLQYRFGTRGAREYVDFWVGVLQPLLDCSDWFLRPDCFVMDSRYLFLNKDGRTISYLYIPSVRPCGDQDALQAMVKELSQKNPVADVALENRALRAIMQDFQPRVFLQLLRETTASQSAPPAPPTAQPPVQQPPRGGFMPPAPAPKPAPAPAPKPAPAPAPAQPPVQQPPRQPIPSGDPDDISISFPQAGAAPAKKEKEKKRGLFGGKKEKPPKKGAKQGEIMLGAPAAPVQQQPWPQQPQPAPGRGMTPPAQVYMPSAGANGLTELMTGSSGPYFRLVGTNTLPESITVSIEPGGTFTIGRYDVTVGRKQCDFEFPEGTVAVSRHHAAVELGMDGTYTIMDLSSSAGTYVDGERLMPNVPRKLVQGVRVSFGNAGANYIWEG